MQGDPEPRDILLSSSTGKDSAWALHTLRSNPRVQVRGLLTTVNETHRRVAMHGVRQELLAAQAAAVGLPLIEVLIPHPCTNQVYEQRLASALERARVQGITGLAFGDLFLADIRRYREAQLAVLGLDTHFPIWGRDTAALAREMIDAGLRAVITCVDPRLCPAEVAGAELDHDLLARLPPSVDPLGEHGEFHTFAYDGPVFARPLLVRRGEVVQRDGFLFVDLLPTAGAP